MPYLKTEEAKLKALPRAESETLIKEMREIEIKRRDDDLMFSNQKEVFDYLADYWRKISV